MATKTNCGSVDLFVANPNLNKNSRSDFFYIAVQCLNKCLITCFEVLQKGAKKLEAMFFMTIKNIEKNIKNIFVEEN